jgi:hypothetical protein
LNKNTKSEKKKKRKKKKKRRRKREKRRKTKKVEKENSLTNMGQAQILPGAGWMRGAGRNAPLTGGK